MSCSGQTNYIPKMQLQCTVTNDTHKDNPFTTAIVVTDGSVVKPYTCHHKTITRMCDGSCDFIAQGTPATPFFVRSKAPFLTNSVSHSSSLVRFRTGS